MEGITAEKLIKTGWKKSGTIDDGFGNTTVWSKKVNGNWYDLYYSGVGEDYILEKHIATTDNMEEINKLVNK